MVFSLSDSYQYSRLDHPDQPQKCKLFSNPICPLVAEDQQLVADLTLDNAILKEVTRGNF